MTFLMVAGAVLQLVGFGLTFCDLRTEQRAVINYLRIPPRVRAGHLVVDVDFGGVAVHPANSLEPTLEARVEALEAAVKHERHARRTDLRNLKKSIAEQIARGDNMVAHDLAERQAELERALIRTQRWPFWLPVALFATGVAATAISALV